MELSGQGVGLLELKLCRFPFRIPAHFSLYVEVVLLDTKPEVTPFFVTRTVVCILRTKPGKQLRFDGIVREL